MFCKTHYLTLTFTKQNSPSLNMCQSKKPIRWFLQQGCHLAFKKAKSALFGLFCNSFLELKWFCHLPFSWPFFNIEEKSIFLGLFWLNFNKKCNILQYFKIYLIYFGKIYIENLAFFTIWEFGLFWNCLWPNLAFFIL